MGVDVVADQTEMDFEGSDYVREFDQSRLTGQLLRVFDLMKDSRWRTLGEIANVTRDPESSISAQLRHLRKEKWGSHTVEKRRRGDESIGLFEYKLIVN